MKHLLVLVIAGLLLVSCKKEKKADPAPSPGGTTPPAYLISIKVDGTEKHCNSCYSGSQSGGIRGSYFNLAGFNEQIYFSCTALPATGAHTLVKYGNPFVVYIKNNTYYRASVGTMSITAIDTSQNGVINRLYATFDFKTDTTSGTFFNITEGSIYLKP